MKLASPLFAILLSAVATAHATPLPYVQVPVSPPIHPGWTATVRSLDVEGRRFAYALSQQICNEDFSVCQSESSIELFDGVSAKTLESSSERFLQFVELTRPLVVWESPNDGYQQFLRKLKPNGQTVTLSDRALYDAWSADGEDVAWQIVDPVTFRWDIVLNGKNITKGRGADISSTNPEVENGNVLFYGDGRYTLYDGAADKLRDLPKFRDDQLPAGVRLSPDGRTAVWLLRDYINDGTERNHELKVYDLATRQTRSYPLGAPVEDLGFDGRYYLWHRGVPAGIELVATDVSNGSTQVLDDAFGDGDGYLLPGTLSFGKLSYILPDGTVALYNLATGHITQVGSDGAYWVASWRKNVGWVSVDAAYNPTMHVAYPANQAVIAIRDVVADYQLSSAVEKRLTNKLDDALAKLDDRKLAQAKSKLQAFNTEVATLKGQGGLNNARAAALTAASNRVIGVL